ncbi:ribosomal RNA-processing protein 17-like [Quillaja saponaria]|uniref:Ribosomal RNA-processing protein 17-like n=1 Tax=Quillaja saponaria TaxID=32244 RepID=A0AAD7M225_QUISA|nr:ribosomal RNA-processing protein 17-like [Quillaja saponaria]
MADEVEVEPIQHTAPRGPYIKKRAIKNKALAVDFNEKDLRDFVTGFHKRKKKRRKEANKKQEEAERRKRIEARKKRKLEREFAMYGGAPAATGSEPDASDEHQEEDEDNEQVESISGTKTYENGDLKVIVTTSEITPEEESCPSEKIQATVPQAVAINKKQNVPVTKKKSFKRTVKHKSRPKPQNKRDKKKVKNGKKKMS